MFRSPDDESESEVYLTMDDETQYRCAGYLQAEIERYAETLSGASKPKPDGSEDSDEDEEEEEKIDGNISFDVFVQPKAYNN